MKKKITQLRWLAATLMLVTAMVMPSVAWAQNTITPSKPTSGDGSSASPYQISNYDELYWFAEHVNDDNTTACAELTADIVADYDWIKIFEYNGTFDGKGHTISGLSFSSDEREACEFGFFGYIGTTSVIRNVGIVNSSFIGWNIVGGVCGLNDGTINNCYFTGTVSSNLEIAGGVCGHNSGTIENCYNTGSVSSYSEKAGGVCGSNAGTINNCYNTGSVSSHYVVGGVCGSNEGTIKNSYYNSTVYGGNAVGWNESATAFENVLGKTTAQFKSGEVCYLLNNGKTDGSQAWYQTLSDSGEEYPNLNKDAENRTVYGAYKHGETSPTCSNSQSSLTMFHTHAYDASASDEANGNHDVSCEPNTQNQYTWNDVDNHTNATANCNFFCKVCNSEVIKDMTVTHDEDKTNVPAKCEEVGYNYYKASLTVNGTEYSSTYTQEVPILRHDDTGDIHINPGKSIYEKVCKREGCGKTFYYADAAGTIEATPNDAEATEFTVANYPLQDATTYDNKAVFTATNFTYTRTFSSTEWTTWYVPFDLTLTADICAKYDFSRINNVHQYDTDNDGTADKTVVESFRQIPGVTLKANYPYLVKAKSDADFLMSLPLTNVVPALAETNSIDCQSVDYKYTFTGTYAGMDDSGSADTDPYTLCAGNKWLHFHSLSPMRHYLTIESRNASSPSPASMRSIMLSIVGDEDTTGIVKLYDEERKASETYDLSGRRLPAGSKPRGLIIENGKVTFKK